MSGVATAIAATRRCAPRSAASPGCPQLLVACDYDGTLAPIVEDPTQAVPLPEAVAALRALAALPQTTVGGRLRPGAARPRRAVPAAERGPPGRQPRLRVRRRLRRAARARAGRAAQPARRRAARHRRRRTRASGWSASRPASRCTLRGADAATWPTRSSTRSGPARRPGPDVHVTARQGGHRAVRGRRPTRAPRSTRCARRSRRSAVLFVGDDVTDENAFADLHGPDVGIKVGAGRDARPATGWPTRRGRARARRCSPETRRRWLFGERAVPIERHSMLANGRTVALLTPDATVTWLCHPQPGLAGALRRPARRRPGRPLLGRPGRRGGMPLGPALPARHDDGRDPLVRPDRHRLARPAATRDADDDALDAGPGADRHAAGAAGVRAAARVRPGRRSRSSRSATACWSSAPTSRSRCYAPGVEWEIHDDGGHETAHGRPSTCRLGGELVLELRFGTDDLATAPRRRRPTARPPPSSRGGTGRPRCTLPPARPRPGAAQRADPARRCATSRPARSSPRPPRRCPRSSAASATGTTATAGCATPR